MPIAIIILSCVFQVSQTPVVRDYEIAKHEYQAMTANEGHKFDSIGESLCLKYSKGEFGHDVSVRSAEQE